MLTLFYAVHCITVIIVSVICAAVKYCYVFSCLIIIIIILS